MNWIEHIMAINRYRKHLLICAEDDAYRDIANGFVKNYAVAAKNIQVDTPAGGLPKLLKIFSEEYIDLLRKYQNCHVLLLLDLDRKNNRTKVVCDKIPLDVRDRVFVLCCRDEAEDVKKDLKCASPERIGEKLAESCHNNTFTVPGDPWLCVQLQNNAPELTRMAATVRPFLFS